MMLMVVIMVVIVCVGGVSIVERVGGEIQLAVVEILFERIELEL